MAAPNPATPFSSWPEPLQMVQQLADTNPKELPAQYIQPEHVRQSLDQRSSTDEPLPVIDLDGLQDPSRRDQTLKELDLACAQWGFFQILNHGVPLSLVHKMRALSRELFALPFEEKQVYANTPTNREGYGSRMGVGPKRSLDWGDHWYLQTMPTSSRDLSKWPTKPALWSETMDEYCEHMKVCAYKLLAILSRNLGLASTALEEAFGGEEQFVQFVRVNFYPPCPRPELALGLYQHADPGGITILLQDDEVEGLQVHRDGRWITVKPVPDALVVNLGDQTQVFSNGRYKSVDHRAIVNDKKQRMSVACFCNPGDDVLVGPLKELVNEGNPARYKTQTFKEYRQMVTQTLNKGDYTLTVEALTVTK